MNLYEINQAIMACCDMETGEIVDYEKLNELTMAREEKLENIALFVKNLTAEAKAIKEEEDALADRRKAKENKAKGLKAYLMDVLAGSVFETAKVKVSYRKSTALAIKDEETLIRWLEQNADDCLKYKAPEVRASGVTKLIKEGTMVPGAELEERRNLMLK